MSWWLVLADGGQPGLTEKLADVAWIFVGAIPVGIFALVIIGIRRLLGKDCLVRDPWRASGTGCGLVAAGPSVRVPEREGFRAGR
jgi:hypothetical protein